LNHDGADEMLGPHAVDHEHVAGARQVLVAPVDDLDAAYGELLSRGVEFLYPPEDRCLGVRCAYFKDPDGNVWEPHQP
jgi:uncharacterized glyoxalase superfamily protein PhnB